MPKQRLTGLDIHALSTELQSLVSYRLQNIYDINSRTFLLKFGLPDTKKNLLVESGFRVHLTTYSREKSTAPSHFVAKLRKVLKTRRLTRLFQLGTDRILVLSFINEINEEKSYHLVFEFFSAGNIMLVSSNYKILFVLRTFRPTVPPGSDPAKFQLYDVGAHYTVLEQHFARPRKYEAMTRTRLQTILTTNSPTEEPEEEEMNALMPQRDSSSAKKSKGNKKKKEEKNTIRKALLSGAAEYGAQLIDEIIRASQIDGNTLINQASNNTIILNRLLEEFTHADEIVKECESNCKGYITAHPPKDPSTNDPIYEDFLPFRPTHLPPSTTLLEYDTFNVALDTFFSLAEATKVQQKHTQAQNTASHRLKAARADHDLRLSNLRTVQEQHVIKAKLLEMNLERVEEALRSVNGLIANGMDWGDIDRLINHERSRGNPVAEIIMKCMFKEGKIILGLREMEDEDEEEDEDLSGDETDEDEEVEEQKDKGSVLEIEVDLGLSAWANARTYFDQKKVAAEKESRTALASSKALKNAERKITADLKRSLKEEKPLMKVLRETKWFEKFYWFISSEGYLILGARDPQQTDLLIRKYFRKGDVYVHSDIPNSSVVIIKNPIENAVIPPGTIAQAGVMAIATSRAWEVKQVTSAWWVPYSQIQRKEEGYDVHGKKTFLPPAMLVLGYGILWTTEDEETMERHTRPLLTDNAHDIVDEISEAEDENVGNTEKPVIEEVESDDISDTMETIPQEDKYNLDQYGSGAEDEAGEDKVGDGEPKPPPSKQHLSAKQRRDLKKGKFTQPQTDSIDAQTDEVTFSAAIASVAKPKAAPQVRGKKGKKKQKARYADQSDEERELAQKLLGAKSEASEKSSETAPPLPANIDDPVVPLKRSVPASTSRQTKPITDEPLEELNLSLKDFIPSPKSVDIISDAVAVCAPWPALARYKYKVKLMPGTTKKGKAARSIVEGFLSKPVDEKGEDAEKMSSREKELLASLKDEDIIQCIWPKSVKVAGGKSEYSKGGKKAPPTKGKGKK